MTSIIAAGLLICFAISGKAAQGGFGSPSVLRYFGGANSAISLQFDDSMQTQLANAVPLLNARGLRATFFVNPAGSYQAHRQEWEVDLPKAGHEVANHTQHHSGAKTIEELTKEIEDCSAELSKIYGPKPRLVSFAIPGGVPWDFKPAQLDPILIKNNLVLATNRNFFDEKTTDPIIFVQQAIDGHTSSNVAMHGTGGEWLSTSIPNLTKLLDFIVAHRPALWVAPAIEIYKYEQERDAALTPVIVAHGEGSFSVEVKCDPTKLPRSAALFDQPLTVAVTVPDSWKSFQVRQGLHTAKYSVQAIGHVAQFEVVPNAGQATVVRD